MIGYTNAGKSSILNALTKSTVLAEDRLFATLDTTTRELYSNSMKIALISDTVGFIQLLPPQLIEAFKSTLSELKYADLLLQVVDVSDPNWQSHIQVVNAILDDLSIHKPMIYVFNKADKVPMIDFLKPRLNTYQPCAITSTLSKEGMEPLISAIHEWQSTRSITPEQSVNQTSE